MLPSWDNHNVVVDNNAHFSYEKKVLSKLMVLSELVIYNIQQKSGN